MAFPGSPPSRATREMLLPTALDLLRPGRHAALQLFKPVLDDVDLRWRQLRLFGGLEHQEALAIGRHVVVGGRNGRKRLVRSLEKHLRRSRGKARLGGDLHRHHLLAAESAPDVPDHSRNLPGGLWWARRRRAFL